MEIRRAREADLDAVRRIARAAYALYVPRIGREPAPMVADFAAALSVGHHWVAGDPAAQGQGVGRRLAAAVERMAAEAGARAVELYTNAAMTENQALYPRLGYRETGRRREDGFDRVFYRKDLGRP